MTGEPSLQYPESRIGHTKGSVRVMIAGQSWYYAGTKSCIDFGTGFSQSFFQGFANQMSDSRWDNILTLPLFPDLTDADVDYVVEALHEFDRAGAIRETAAAK